MILLINTLARSLGLPRSAPFTEECFVDDANLLREVYLKRLHFWDSPSKWPGLFVSFPLYAALQKETPVDNTTESEMDAAKIE
jgi:hypothetical protein